MKALERSPSRSVCRPAPTTRGASCCDSAAQALHWPTQPMAGVVMVGMAVVLGTTWRALEHDPALAAPVAGAASSWPAGAPLPTKAAFFLRHLPELLLRATFTHWATFRAPMLLCTLALAVAGRWLHSRRVRTAAAALSFIISMAAFPLAAAICQGVDEAGLACESYSKSNLLQCPPCESITPTTQIMDGMLTWRFGFYIVVMWLPPGVIQLASGFSLWFGMWSHLVIYAARYGVSPTSPCQHAPAPLTWASLASGMTAQTLQLPALLSCTLLPLAISLMYARMCALRLRGAYQRGTTCCKAEWAEVACDCSGSGTICQGASGSGSSITTAAQSASGDGGGRVERSASGSGSISACSPAKQPAPATPSAQPSQATSSNPAASASASTIRSRRHSISAPTEMLLLLPAATDAGNGASSVSATTQPAAVALAGPLVQYALALTQLQSRSQIKLAAQGRGALYASLFKHAAMHAKFDSESSANNAYAELAARAPELMRDALLQPALSAQQPVLLSVVTFPGCVHAAAQLLVSQALQGNGAAMAVLAPVVPRGVQLLHACTTTLEEQAAAASGMWCAPLALHAGAAAATAVHVALPLRLVLQLAAAGRGLRVVATVSTQAAPLADITLRPGSAGWPADGLLRMEVPPCGGTGLLLLHLLSAAPLAVGAGGGAPHGADTFITAIPLLVLPAAAAAEVEQLFGVMLNDWQEENPAASLEIAAAAVFSDHMMPFAHDYAMLLQHSALVQPLGGIGSMLSFLESNSMHTCLELLRAATGASGAAAAEEQPGVSGAPCPDDPSAPGPSKPSAARLAQAGAGDDAMPVLTMAAVLRGFGSPKHERAFQLWRSQQLQARSQDAWAIAIQAIRQAMPLWGMYRVAWASSIPRAGELVLAVALRAMIGMLPAALFLGANAVFVRWHGLSWALGMMCAGVSTPCLFHYLGTPEAWYQLGPLVFLRPLALVMVSQVVGPFVLMLNPWQQLLASMGQACTTHAVSIRSSRGAYGWGAHAGFLMGTFSISCIVEWYNRYQWLRSGAPLPPAATLRAVAKPPAAAACI